MEQREPGHPKGCCFDRHGHLLYEKFYTLVEKRGLVHSVRVTPTGCLGPCSEGGVCVVYPEATWYGNVKLADVIEIMDKHIGQGQPVARLVLPEEALD